MGISFTGEIVAFSGLYFGTVHDIAIWRAISPSLALFPWELGMADLAYVGAAGLVTKIKGAVAPADILFNNIHEHIRNRIENVISKVKARALSRQPLSRPLLASSQYNPAS